MHLCRLNNLSYVFSKEDCIFSCYVMTSRPSITAIPGINFWVVVLAINISLTNLLIIDAEQNHLVLTIQLQPKHLYVQGQTLTYQSLVKHKPDSNETAANVSLDWVLPSYISYQSYKSLSKTPINVATNIDKFATKFGSLSPSEEINIHINVTVDPGHTLPDNHFHHATVSTTLKYSWLHQCSKEITSSNVLHIPFFSPVCSDFGSLGMATGNIKDSQIQASTVRTYRSSDNAWAWEPMTSFVHLNEKRKMKFNFLQIDLKSSRPVDIVFVDGIPARDPIPWNIIQLSFSDNNWRWKTQKNLQKSKVFHGEDTVAVAITTLTPIKTRFIRINVPPYGVLGGASYKVQVFGCNPNQILDPDSSPVGIESSSLVPDSRFNSPSILGPQYQPHFGRLNTKVGGGSWCASGCSQLQYLQIDLGDTWRISEIENQGRHSTNGSVVAVKTYSLSSSLDGAVWTPYKTNGRTNIFWGNHVVNLATRHKLFQPLTVKIIRFEPRTCTESVACMRVELYGTKTSVVERKVSPEVVLGRSMLLKPAENILFVCNTEVSENNAHCFSSQDKGSTWKGILQVLSILAFDSNEKRLYGLSRNGENIMKSKDPNGDKWRGIPLKRWLSVRDGSLLFTAVEIPFVPISRNETNVIEPIAQLTAFSGDMWQADQIGVYHKPAGGSSKMVLSFLPYSQDLSPNPCHTGVCTYGRCEQLVRSQFKCHCREGYTGRFCDTATNYCSTNPCQNGGTCSPLFLSFKCSCQPGYSADRCQDYDECISSPCLNGGTCVDGDNKFTCTCAPNYSGVTCQEFDHCSSSPCLHRGTCTDGASSYTCSCLPGYSGTNCQVTPCSSGPCLNGGTCSHPDAGGFLCACTIQYSGTHCRNGPFLLQRGFLSSSTSDVWSTSSGKFDKIVFRSDKNLTVLAVCISDTFAFGSVACPFETRIRKEGTTTILVSISGNANCKKDTKYSICPHFASPYRTEAGTRYILEVRMTSTANIRKVINGLSSRTISLSDGSPSVTFNYETVDAAELADSNGSNQSEGGIVGLAVQIAK